MHHLMLHFFCVIKRRLCSLGHQNDFVSISACSVDHLSCAGLPKSPVDPCSRESVLKVLKETRKRNVEDEDRSFTAEQRNKRR